MSDDLTKFSASTLARLIREREASPVEVVEAHLRTIESLNPKINAIITLAYDAIDRAREAEEAIMKGEESGLLHGVPVTIKDTIATKSLRTTSGSKRLANHIPDKDATVVSLLKEAGAIIIGKTNTAEMAMSYECDNPLFGRTNNPHDLTKTSGGSSGGDAAAVSSNMTPIGIGSDLMGSVRLPAHFCGVYGLKPTTGRVSMRGHFPKAEGVYSLGAVIGTLTKYVEDAELVFNVIANSPSPKSKVQSPKSENKIRNPQSAIRNRKVCFYTSDGITPVTSETKETVIKTAKLFSDAGFIVEEKLPPHVERGAEFWRRLFMRGGLQTLEELYNGHEEDAGETVRAILNHKDKTVQSLDDFLAAWTERDRARAELIKWMKEYPFIIAPVGATAAFEHGARRVDVEGQTLNLMQAFSYCQTWNVFGFPSLSVPVYKTKEGLPIGVQIIGAPFSESDLFEAAAILQLKQL